MSASQFGYFNFQAIASDGDLGEDYRLYSYVAGTTTHKNVYTEPTGVTAHTYTSDGIGGQYIACNARGELPAPMYGTSGAYDLTLKTPAGSTVWTRRTTAVGEEFLADLSAPGGSDLVGFIQAGTGAEARTAQDKMREWVSPEDFGAVGDGATDDAAPLQEFLQYLADHGGNGLLGAKEYLTTAALVLTSPTYGFSIRGAGPESVIKQRTLSAVSCLSIVAPHDILMDGFAIDCGYSVTGFASHGISMRNADRVTVQNVQVHDHRNAAMLTFVDADDTYGDCHFINCLSKSNGAGQNGFLHEGMLHSSIQNCTVLPLDPAGYPCCGLQIKNVSRHCWIIGGYAEGCKGGVVMGGDGSTFGDGPWDCVVEGVITKDCLDGVLLGKTTNCTIKAYTDQTASPAPSGVTGYAVNIAGFNDRVYVEAHIKGVQSGRTCVRIGSDDSHVYIPYADGIGTYIARLEAGVNDASVVFGFSPQKPTDLLALIDDQSAQTDNEFLYLRNLPIHGMGTTTYLRFPTSVTAGNFIAFSPTLKYFNFRVDDDDRLHIGETFVRPEPDQELSLGESDKSWTTMFGQHLALVDAVSAPSTSANHALIYVDSSDGDLKVKFKDGTVKTIATDS